MGVVVYTTGLPRFALDHLSGDAENGRAHEGLEGREARVENDQRPKGSMQVKRKRIYPPNWKEIVSKVRERAKDRCECTGQCGLHKTTGGPRRCEEKHRQKAKWARGVVILTTAHLCHDSQCSDLSHLILACNRCHLRIDLEQHMTNAAETRRLKKEYDERNQLKFA